MNAVIQFEYTLLVITLSMLVAVIKLIFDIKRNLHADIQKKIGLEREEAEQSIRHTVQMDMLLKGINDINSKLGGMSKELKEYHERLVKVEAAAEEAHNRLDRLVR